MKWLKSWNKLKTDTFALKIIQQEFEAYGGFYYSNLFYLIKEISSKDMSFYKNIEEFNLLLNFKNLKKLELIITERLKKKKSL